MKIFNFTLTIPSKMAKPRLHENKTGQIQD